MRWRREGRGRRQLCGCEGEATLRRRSERGELREKGEGEFLRKVRGNLGGGKV